MSEPIELGVDRFERIVLITIRSEPLGVLRHSVKKQFEEALAELEADPEVRALVVTGQGRAFSVGSDIREFKADSDWQIENTNLEHRLYFKLESSRLPIIAACNGLTLGGGAELALACDFRLAAESATFGFPEVHVGAIASGGGTQRLPEVVGPGRAAELLMTGRSFSARDALAYGLVEEVVPDHALLDRAFEIADDIASQPLIAVAATKRSLKGDPVRGRPPNYELTAEISVALGCSSLAIEGQRAFLEKRPMELTDDHTAEAMDWIERHAQA